MIVTLAQARAHLRLSAAEGATDLVDKLAAAEAVVLDYIRRPDDADWTARIEDWVAGATVSPAAEVPLQIKAAILMQMAELWAFRGDDLDGPKREAPGDLSPTIKALLYKFRDPALR